MSHQVEKATLKFVHSCKRVQPVFLPGGKGYMLRETSKPDLLFQTMSHQLEKATLNYVHGYNRVQPLFLPGGKGYILREASKPVLLFRRPILLSAVSDVY